MYTQRSIQPLTVNTQSNSDGKIFATTAAFRYIEDSKSTSTNQPIRRQTSVNNSSPRKRTSPHVSMNGYPGSIASPPGMYVQALYDYDADDQTSLSFRQGDLIQVLTQLESGWWDGVINNVRGWFPSNYCAVVTGPEQNGNDQQHAPSEDETSGESGTEDEYREYPGELDSSQRQSNNAAQSLSEDVDRQEQEEAAFWIPQATPDGRLFYFNTLTGLSKMELPLETPTSANETGPRDRMNIRIPDQTRPPPEMMARGFVREEDEDRTSVSEAEGESLLHSSRGSLRNQRRSYISDGVSPVASMDSLNASPILRSRNDSQDFYGAHLQEHQPSGGKSGTDTSATSFTGNLPGQPAMMAMPSSFYDDGSTPLLTWNRLVENMQKSVESYRQAINNADRSEYVRKAEDISDHLRMLLVAGSLTTDNHSGNPSIISANKALYPHFRDMMSRFSKLVLSSHIAAADWPAPDSYSKCLQEAEGVLRGVQSYVDVARAQRGEVIPRLSPGFVLGSHNGGSWQNNHLATKDITPSPPFMEQEDSETRPEPSSRLDQSLLDRMEDLKRLIVSGIRRIDEQLVVTEKIITPIRHEQISNSICTAAGKVIELFRPYISTIESIDLAPLDSAFQNSQIHDFSTLKQRLYDLVANLLVACQTVAAPLSDEWAEIRGEPFENRVREVRNVTKSLETSVSQIALALQRLLDNVSQGPTQQQKDAQTREAHRRTDGGAIYQSSLLRNDSLAFQRPQLASVGHSMSYSEGIDPATENYRVENSKVKKFFGEVPTPIMPKRDSEETPSFLKLDHEGEISFDDKITPPQLRGGTLTALVEQLTRHDRLDSPFNNTFLLTYKSFTTASELFDMLVKRFNIQPPRGINIDDFQTWVEQKQKPIRFRVVNILKSWFDSYWMENNDQNSNELLRRVFSFAKDSVATTNTPGSQPLMTVVEQRIKGQDFSAKRLVLTLNTSTPVPTLPKNMKKLKFLDIDVTEFARQLTIIESKLYGKIKPTECLNKTWQKKPAEGEPEPAPNVKALILHSNQLTNWVAEMILTQSDVKRRVVVIKHFVSVADVRARNPCCIPTYLLTWAEMPPTQQLFNFDFHHIRSRHRSNPSTSPNVGSSQRSNIVRA